MADSESATWRSGHKAAAASLSKFTVNTVTTVAIGPLMWEFPVGTYNAATIAVDIAIAGGYASGKAASDTTGFKTVLPTEVNRG